MRATRAALIVTGSMAALLAAALLAGAFWIHRVDIDSAGYVVSGAHRAETASYAFATRDLDLVGDFDWFVERGQRLRLSAESSKPLFIGIAATDDVERYLAGVAHDEVRALDLDRLSLTTASRAGTADPGAPARQSFWEASVQGAGRQTLDLPDGDGRGRLSIVVMNADGSTGLDAEFTAGAHVPYLSWVGLGGLIGGALLALGAAGLFYLGLRPMSRRPVSPTPARAA